MKLKISIIALIILLMCIFIKPIFWLIVSLVVAIVLVLIYNYVKNVLVKWMMVRTLSKMAKRYDHDPETQKQLVDLKDLMKQTDFNAKDDE